MAPLLAYLDQLHPLLWRKGKGKAFPQNYPDMKQKLADGDSTSSSPSIRRKPRPGSPPASCRTRYAPSCFPPERSVVPISSPFPTMPTPMLPYVVLSLSQPWQAFDRRYERVAAGLGKTPLTILLRIRLPMLTRACLTAFAVGFAVSAGLYLPTLLIGAGRIATITTEAVALSSGGDRRIIGVYALLQTIVPFAGFLIASLVPHLLFRDRRAMRI